MDELVDRSERGPCATHVVGVSEVTRLVPHHDTGSPR
jgi:hypothetical protein